MNNRGFPLIFLNDSYADVCLRLAECYHYEIGTDKDKGKAETYLRIARDEAKKRLDRGDAYGKLIYKEILKEWKELISDSADLYQMYEFLEYVYQTGVENITGEKDLSEYMVFCARKLMEADDAAGFYYMAVIYEQGIGISQDAEKAIEMYIKAGDKGAEFGYEYAGQLFHLGEDVPQDHEKALALLTKGDSSKKQAESLYILGEIYRLGLGTEISLDDAATYYIYSIMGFNELLEHEEELPPSQKQHIWSMLARADYHVAEMFMSGDTELGQDFDEARRLIDEAVGIAYYEDERTVLYDITREMISAKWEEIQIKADWMLLKKADSGDLEAMKTLVFQTLTKRFLDDTLEREITSRQIHYLTQLANAGNTYAFIMLGDAFRQGQGIKKDMERAIYWYQKAAENGDGFGNECIGMMYYEGIDLPTDYQKAYDYFTKNDGKKSFSTLYTLGEMYRLGLYIKQNDDKACACYKGIVNDDGPYREHDDYYWRACYRLSVATYYGYGTEKDYDKAVELLDKARSLYELRSNAAPKADISVFDIMYKNWEPYPLQKSALKVTPEMVRSAESCTGLLAHYGSKEVEELYIVLTANDVIRFNCVSREWSEANSDSYWDLYESEAMMTVMTEFEPEEAVEFLEKMHAFDD